MKKPYLLETTDLPGCFTLHPHVHHDLRGSFSKVFQADYFKEDGLTTNFVEEFYTCSFKHVLRGLHFQVPPYDHTKMVYCVHGRVWDVVLDLRKGSPAFGQYIHKELEAELGTILYIPTGCAHGFIALQDQSIMVYKVTSGYAPEHDAGIRWDGAGISWPDINPILSSRDASFPCLSEFQTPFVK